MGMMTKAREHRGSFDESMATVQPVATMRDLIARISRDLAPFGVKVSAENVHVEPYTFDHRVGWDTYLVTVDGYGVWGMTDGAPAKSLTIEERADKIVSAIQREIVTVQFRENLIDALKAAVAAESEVPAAYTRKLQALGGMLSSMAVLQVKYKGSTLDHA